MRFTSSAAAFLALLSTVDAASFFQSSPSTTRIASSTSPASRQNGWFLGTDVRGGATGELGLFCCSLDSPAVYLSSLFVCALHQPIGLGIHGLRRFPACSCFLTHSFLCINRSSSRRSAQQKKEEEEKGCRLEKKGFETSRRG